jgi:hypothetical protein
MTNSSKETSEIDRAARRAVFLDAIPVVILGAIALPLGSSGNPSGSREALWVATSVIFTLSVAWVLFRSFRRADEYQRKIQLESMAVAFAAVLVALQIAGVLDAAGIGDLRQFLQLIVIGGILTWLLAADLRTRFHR